MLETFLTQLQGPVLSLWGPFAIIVLCGFGIPIPEDLVLLVAGALAAVEDRSWVGVSVVMYLAVMGGDSLMFGLGRWIGGSLLATRLGHKLFTPAKRASIQRFFDRHGAKGLFIARFLPGLRSLIFFSAGSLRVRYLTFLMWDGLAALLSVPVFVWLGHFLWDRYGTDIAQFNAAVDEAHQWTGWVVGAALAVIALWVWRNNRRR